MLEKAEVQEEKPSVEKPQETPEGWEAKILAFACHYCAFAAADLAGVMRLSYPPNVKIIRIHREDKNPRPVTRVVCVAKTKRSEKTRLMHQEDI
jgi:hypothetical protein